MLKFLAIAALWLSCAWVMASQGDKNASPSQQPTTQQQALHTLNGEDRRANPDNNQNQPSSGPPAGNATVEGNKVWWRDSNWWLVIIAAFTGGFICWQGWETRKAAQATRDSVGAANKEYALAENTAKRQLRAYLCVDSSRMRFKAGCPWVKVVIKNCGQTPAYKVQGWIGVELAEYLPSPTFGKPNNAGIMLCNTVLGAGGTIELETVRQFTENDSTSFLNGVKTLFVYGFISYEDAFGEAQHTGFRLISGRGDPPNYSIENAVQIYRFYTDNQGNEAT